MATEAPATEDLRLKAAAQNPQAALGSAKATSSSKGDDDRALTFEQETAQCEQCGAEFARTVVLAGGRRLGAPTAAVCAACDPDPTEPVRAPRASPFLVALAQVGVNVHQHGYATFQSYEAPAGSTALAAAATFAEQVRTAEPFQPVRGLYLTGPTGAGKTHLAVAAVRHVLDDMRGSDGIVFVRASRLITDLQDTYGSGRTGAFLDRLERARLLVLDDFGTEKATEDTQRMMFDLLNAREGRATLITSNLAPKEIGERWRDSDAWARIASRLGTAQYRLVAVRGEDRRFRAP